MTEVKPIGSQRGRSVSLRDRRASARRRQSRRCPVRWGHSVGLPSSVRQTSSFGKSPPLKPSTSTKSQGAMCPSSKSGDGSGSPRNSCISAQRALPSSGTSLLGQRGLANAGMAGEAELLHVRAPSTFSHSSPSGLEPVGTAPSRRSRTRSSRPASVAASPCNARTHRRTGMHRAA